MGYLEGFRGEGFRGRVMGDPLSPPLEGQACDELRVQDGQSVRVEVGYKRSCAGAGAWRIGSQQALLTERQSRQIIRSQEGAFSGRTNSPKGLFPSLGPYSF